MKIKKTLALLAAMSLMGTFAACGKAEDTGSSTAEESSAAETTAAPEETSAPETTTAPEESSEEEPVVLEVDENAITFDDGDLHTCHMMGDGDGEANCDISVVDYNGDKKMRVEVLDQNDKGEYLIPKLVWNLADMLGVDNLDKIGKITMDITFEARSTTTFDDGTEGKVLQWNGGAVAGSLAPEKLNDEDGNLLQNTWAQQDWELNDWEHDTATLRIETDIPFKKLPVNGFTNNESTTLVFMRWATKVDTVMYFDNITFYDKDGKSMVVNASGETAPAEGGEESSEETPAETTAAAE